VAQVGRGSGVVWEVLQLCLRADVPHGQAASAAFASTVHQEQVT
jgi:hypothetical protein